MVDHIKNLESEKSWTKHYKYWKKVFNDVEKIGQTLIELSFIDSLDSSLDTYFMEINPPRGVIHTNPLSYALATSSKVEDLILISRKKPQFHDFIYNLIYTVFIDSSYGQNPKKEEYKVSFLLFDYFKDDVDWFGLFYTMRTYFKTENLDYEKELYQKYYDDIFKMDESHDRPDKTSGFWKAIALGVELPMDYVKESIMDRKTVFAIDKDNLFYPMLHRFWETNEFDIYVPEEIKNEGKQNIVNFMNHIKNDKELYLFIKLQ